MIGDQAGNTLRDAVQHVVDTWDQERDGADAPDVLDALCDLLAVAVVQDLDGEGRRTSIPTSEPKCDAPARRGTRVRIVQSLIGGSLDVRRGSLAEQIVDALDAADGAS